MSTDSPRAVYDYRVAYWWNVACLSIIAGGGVVSLAMRVVDGELAALAFGVVWFGVVAFVARGVVFSTLYRLEADEQSLFWRRRGTEHAAPLSEVTSISGSANVGTVRFRDGRRSLKVFIGGGFNSFTEYVGDQAAGISVDLGWASRLSGRLFLGGGFSAPDQS